MTVCHSSRDDPGDVDGRVLLPSSHYVEAKAFISLRQLHDSGVRMALTCSKGSYSSLGSEEQLMNTFIYGNSKFELLFKDTMEPHHSSVSLLIQLGIHVTFSNKI